MNEQTTNALIHLPCDLAPVVCTDTGDVQGRWQNSTSAAYLGIPFAAPPVGPNRFRAPAPVESWSGVRPALEYGATPQIQKFGGEGSVPEPSITGESTLNVNVFTPAPRDRRAKLPVLVWIHGGGFYAGSPASPWYNGSSFNRDGVVTVTISYRLGFDGFGWIEDAPMNRGLLDQIAALTWVQRNIAEFGGDPDNVTIAGQSAGGSSVQALVVSPKAKGLFHKAISESGAYGQPTLAEAQEVGRSMADAKRIAPTIEGWSSLTPMEVVQAQKPHEQDGKPPLVFTVDQVFDALAQGYIGDGGLMFAPVVDGNVLPDKVSAMLAAGVGKDIPLIAGAARDEFYFPLPAPPYDEYIAALRSRGLSREAVARFEADVHRIGEERVHGEIMTMWMFHIGLAHLAESRAKTGAGSRTWLYDFAQFHAPTGGSTHCSDIPYFFDLLGAPNVENVVGRYPSQPLADAMHSMWVSFIKTGQLEYPSVAEGGLGALRFQNGVSFCKDSYALAGEVLAAAGDR